MYVPSGGRRDKLSFIRQKLREGRQAYFVYPLVDESDKIALQSAIQAHGELSVQFKEFRVALLHGRMKVSLSRFPAAGTCIVRTSLRPGGISSSTLRSRSP